MNLDYEGFHQRLLVFRVSLYPGTRVVRGEEGTVVELPVWFARMGEETASGETPIEAVDKLVGSVGGSRVAKVGWRDRVRSADPRGALTDAGS
jgi:hypothetical protein